MARSTSDASDMEFTSLEQRARVGGLAFQSLMPGYPQCISNGRAGNAALSRKTDDESVVRENGVLFSVAVHTMEDTEISLASGKKRLMDMRRRVEEVRKARVELLKRRSAAGSAYAQFTAQKDLPESKSIVETTLDQSRQRIETCQSSTPEYFAGVVQEMEGLDTISGNEVAAKIIEALKKRETELTATHKRELQAAEQRRQSDLAAQKHSLSELHSISAANTNTALLERIKELELQCKTSEQSYDEVLVEAKKRRKANLEAQEQPLKELHSSSVTSTYKDLQECIEGLKSRCRTCQQTHDEALSEADQRRWDDLRFLHASMQEKIDRLQAANLILAKQSEKHARKLKEIAADHNLELEHVKREHGRELQGAEKRRQSHLARLEEGARRLRQQQRADLRAYEANVARLEEERREALDLIELAYGTSRPISE